MKKGAKRENKTVMEIAKFYTDAFFADCEKLRIKRPDVVEPATNCIAQFIEMIEELNKSLDIPSSLKEVILDEDIPIMVKRAMKEAIPLYPTPTIWKYKDFEKIFKLLQK